MRRRDFLGGAAAALSLGVGAARGQTPPRAAVVIGVNKPGRLTVLRAAVSGAEQVARWLASQSFDVTTFVDSVKPVRVADIFNAVYGVVDKGVYEQVVVYFAGHGCLNQCSEVWLLSEAPVNPSEAINVQSSIGNAYLSGIRNIVFISDACRSAPNSIQAGAVTGASIFPNDDSRISAETTVDEFYATLPGSVALEWSQDKSTKNYQGVYTSVFLDAFRHPAKGMPVPVNGVMVVPNRKLPDFLRVEVPRRAAVYALESQTPQSIVPSPDETYIGRLADDAVVAAAELRPPPTIHDVLAMSIDNAAKGFAPDIQDALQDASSIIAVPRPFSPTPPGPLVPPGVDRPSLLPLGVDRPPLLPLGVDRPPLQIGIPGYSQFSATVSQIMAAPSTPALLEPTAFTIRGTRVAAVTVSPGFEARMRESGELAVIEITGRQRRSGSIAVRFADGTGSVFAILPGFIAAVTVDGDGVSNVNYNPSQDNPMHAAFDVAKPRLDELRATVAAAARFGGLYAGPSQEETEAWGDRIRILKGIDPTLGLYAAYAFDRAGKFQKAASVSANLTGDLGTEFFDTAMLAGKLAGKPFQDKSAAPFAPMLAMGWALLPVKRVNVDRRLLDARSRLRPAPWTTYAPQDIELVWGLVRTS